MGRLINFIKHPHIPYYITELIRQISPLTARLLLYGKININTKERANECWAKPEN